MTVGLRNSFMAPQGDMGELNSAVGHAPTRVCQIGHDQTLYPRAI
jgi:hypothetical protein